MGLGPTVYAVSWTELAVVSVLYIARLYVNAFILRRFRADFWWATVTYITALVSQAFLVLSVHWGLGTPLADLQPFQIVKNQFYQWVFTTLAITSIALGKLTIIVFMLQFERLDGKNRRVWILYVIGVLTILVNVAIIPILWTQCSPTVKIWNNSVPGNCAGRAINEKYGYFQGSFGAVCDLALALYPMLAFWNLQMEMHVKVGLTALFGCGIAAAICAAVKTKELSTVTAESDLTYQLASLNIWASTEMWTILMVSCIPPIRPLFVKAFHTVTSSGGRSRGTANQNSPAYGLSGPYASRSNVKRPAITTTNESEEDILQERDGIMMTRKISIHYDERDVSNNSGGRSMGS